ncbi:hypothetical protein MTO96_041406 [Rhipicephalus appendiculatus]
MSSRRTPSTSSSSSSGSSDASTVSVSQGRDSSSSLHNQLFITAAKEPREPQPSSAAQQQPGSAATGAVGGVGGVTDKPDSSKSGGKPQQRSEESTNSLQMHRAPSPAQQNFPDLGKRPQDQHGDRKGRGKPGFDEGMKAAEVVPGDGGRGVAERARPAARPGGSTSPSLRSPCTTSSLSNHPQDKSTVPNREPDNLSGRNMSSQKRASSR